MELNIELHKPLPNELKRNAKNLIEESILHCTKTGSQRHVAVHDLRKNLKKLRALLRIVRYSIGKPNYKELNVFYRDTGRLLSHMRDATARLESLEHLKEQFSSSVKIIVFNEARSGLIDYRRRLTRQVLTKEQTLQKVKDLLEEGLSNVDHWSIPKGNFSIIKEGIASVYSNGHETFKLVKKEPNVENYHQWRKQVKYLMYQIRIISSVWSAIFDVYQLELQTLSDLLGLDHDLSVLQDATDENIIVFKDKRNKQVFTSLLNKYSKELRRQAIPLGEKLFADNPDSFILRLENIFGAENLIK